MKKINNRQTPQLIIATTAAILTPPLPLFLLPPAGEREVATDTAGRDALGPDPSTEMELSLAVRGMKWAGPVPPRPPTKVATRPVPSPVWGWDRHR